MIATNHTNVSRWSPDNTRRLQFSQHCAVLCHIVPFQYVSRSSLHRLAGLPCRHFLWSPSGDTRGPSVVFDAVDMPCPGQFHFSHIADYIYDFCPLPDSDVGISILVSDVVLSSYISCTVVTSLLNRMVRYH